MDPYYSHVTTGYRSNHGKYEIWEISTLQICYKGFKVFRCYTRSIIYICQIMRSCIIF